MDNILWKILLKHNNRNWKKIGPLDAKYANNDTAQKKNKAYHRYGNSFVTQVRGTAV